MHIPIDHHSGEPIYRQIVESVKFLIARGELSEGQKLPSIRKLSEQLKINPRTVIKAYEELDRSGLAVMQQGRGVFVTSPQAILPPRKRRKAIESQVRRLMAEASRLGATPSEVRDIVDSVAGEMVKDS